MSEQEPSELPIEEIEAAQRAHEEKILQEKREADEAAERERQLKAQAGEDYGKRQDLLVELREVDVGAKKLEAEGIKERMAQAERLKGLKTEREATLDDLQAEIKLAAERLKQIEGLVAGKSEEMVAETTRKMLAAARAKFQDLDGQARTLADEVGKIGEQIVSDEMVKRYQELLTQSSELNGQIDGISSNPALVELMEKEAADEDRVRGQIKLAAMSKCQQFASGYPSNEREAFLGQLIQTFITEEFQARGIDEIKDQGERMRQMNVLKAGVIAGINEGDYERIARRPQNEQVMGQYTGMLLRNLVGGYGTLGGTLGFLTVAEKGYIKLGEYYDDKAVAREKQLLPRAVMKHLRTLNLIKSYNEGVANNHHRKQVATCTDNWGEFDRGYKLTQDFDNQPNFPLMPHDVDPVLKQQLAEEFEQNKAGAQNIDQELTQQEEQEKQQAIKEIEDKIAEIDAGIKICEEAQRINQGRPIEHRDLEERGKGLKAMEEEQVQIGRDIQRYEDALRQLGLFARSEKRDLRERIDKKLNRLNYLRGNLPVFDSDARTIREALEIMNKYDSRSISQLQDKRAGLQRQLERIQRGY